MYDVVGLNDIRDEQMLEKKPRDVTFENLDEDTEFASH